MGSQRRVSGLRVRVGGVRLGLALGRAATCAWQIGFSAWASALVGALVGNGVSSTSIVGKVQISSSLKAQGAVEDAAMLDTIAVLKAGSRRGRRRKRWAVGTLINGESKRYGVARRLCDLEGRVCGVEVGVGCGARDRCRRAEDERSAYMECMR